MVNESNSVISLKNAKNSLGCYIYESPCLKTLFYNPFIISAVILLILWGMDFVYGKSFPAKTGVAVYVRHLITTYALVSIAVWMNNAIFLHKLKIYKSELKKEESIDDQQMDDKKIDDLPRTANYVEQDSI